ncbi:MAG: DUF192 domain-containing protein [Actinobacteria bacterium]|nr:DUF192 domain-containing protein [Actinomycetota bacterium]
MCSCEPSVTGGSSESPGTASTGSEVSGPGFSTGTGLIRTGDRSIRLELEIARSPAQRAFGLMHRRSLGERAGMIFLYETKSTGGFYMKDTLIPLSIAFLDGQGKILRILDMDPCREEPCKVYYPHVAYKRALEVNQGALASWGVSEGDVIELHT